MNWRVAGCGVFKNPRAESTRLRALYRDMVLRGRLRAAGHGQALSMRALVGPDCAYHLYRGFSGGGKK